MTSQDQLPAAMENGRSGEPSPIVHSVFEKSTGSWQYIVADATTSKAVIIDPVLDYDAATASISTQTADLLLQKVGAAGYTIDMILETHAHADHITAASYLQGRLAETQGHRPIIGIGRRITQVQDTFGPRYDMDRGDFEGAFDKFFDDDEAFSLGRLDCVALHVPGHTPDHMAYRIGADNVFTGDSIFHADLGTARADFSGGSAEDLFASGRKLLSLPDHVRIWPGHDYPPEGRKAPASGLTVAEHKAQNKHLKDAIQEEEFLKIRKQRDATLAEPKLLHPSIKMNLRAGKLPESMLPGHQVPLEMGDL